MRALNKIQATPATSCILPWVLAPLGTLMSLGVGALSVPFAWLPPLLESVPVGVGLRLADGSLVHVAPEDSTEFRFELAYVHVSPSTFKEHENKMQNRSRRGLCSSFPEPNQGTVCGGNFPSTREMFDILIGSEGKKTIASLAAFRTVAINTYPSAHNSFVWVSQLSKR